MPSYSTKEMVRNALAPGDWATDRQPDQDQPTRTAADLDDKQIDDAIAEADALIDGQLALRYETPFVLGDGVDGHAPTHPIDYLSRNIAAYNATLTYRKGQDLDDNDPVMLRYRDSIKFLTDVRDGKAALPQGFPTQGADGVGPITAGNPINPNPGPLFGRDDFDIAPIGASWPEQRPVFGNGRYWPW